MYPGVVFQRHCLRPVVRCARALVVFLLAALALIVGTGAERADAHAQLMSTEPVAGAHLATAPHQVRLTFGERVSFVTGGFRLLDHSAKALKMGSAREDGSTVTVPIKDSLPDGSYVFVYRVVSADTHPVSGSVPFSVGAAQSGAMAVAPSSDTPAATRVLAGINRWIGYVGAVLSIGVLAFVALCWRGGSEDRLARRLASVGAALLAVTAAIGLPLQASSAVGEGLSQVFGDGSITGVLHTVYGRAAVLRIFCGALLAVLVVLRADRHRFGQVLGGLAIVGCLYSFAWGGHSSVSSVPVLTMTDDALHLAAVCAWVGGLVLLVVRLLPNPPRESAQVGLAPVLRRWSTLAMWAVATIVVTGTVQAWRQLGSFRALGETGYGRWVITKSVGLLILVALGNLGRIRVRRYAAAGIAGLQRTGASLGAMRAEPQEDGLDRLRRSVFAEVLIAAGVLVASAMLVVSNPSLPRSAASGAMGAGAMGAGAMGAGAMGAGAMSGSDHAAPASACSKAVLPNAVTAKICVAPAVSGTPTVTVLITSTASGAAVDPVEVTATAALPAHGVEPIPLHLVRTGHGRWTAAGAPMGFAGEWQITVTARTSEIDAGVGMVHVVLH